MNPLKPDFAANYNWFNKVSRGPTTVFGARGEGGPDENGVHYAGGGPHVEIWHEGVKEYNGYPFESSFRGGVQVTVLPDGDVLVGAGKGGGPRWQRWTRTEPVFPWLKAKWKEMSNQFLGGKIGSEQRTGCGFTPTGLPVYGYAEVNVTLPVQPLLAQPWPGLEGDTLRANAILSAVPLALQERCVKKGVTCWVYAGTAITDMPEFRHLRGVRTDAAGDGGRTWDQVPGKCEGSSCWVNESGLHLLHEVGHLVSDFIRFAPYPFTEWLLLWKENVGKWATPYERDNIGEAFAETIRRHIERPASNDHLRGVREYFARHLPEIGGVA